MIILTVTHAGTAAVKVASTIASMAAVLSKMIHGARIARNGVTSATPKKQYRLTLPALLLEVSGYE
jgi:hypothetical protein